MRWKLGGRSRTSEDLPDPTGRIQTAGQAEGCVFESHPPFHYRRSEPVLKPPNVADSDVVQRVSEQPIRPGRNAAFAVRTLDYGGVGPRSALRAPSCSQAKVPGIVTEAPDAR